MSGLYKLYRLSHRLRSFGLPRIARIVDGVSRVIYAANVPGGACIGPRVFFHHSGLGVVINVQSVIEEDCEIGVHVVLGGRAPLAGAPHLERGVIVHAGAKVIGPIRIGEGSIVAANAVVLESMPARSLIAGIPAVVRRTDIESKLYSHTPHVGSIES